MILSVQVVTGDGIEVGDQLAHAGDQGHPLELAGQIIGNSSVYNSSGQYYGSAAFFYSDGKFIRGASIPASYPDLTAPEIGAPAPIWQATRGILPAGARVLVFP